MAVLYDRDELFTFVANLVGLSFKKPDRRLAHHDVRPIVAVAGGRGMGKTAVLKEIADAYGNRAPYVRLDLAAKRYSGTRSDSDPGSDSALLRLLRDLKWDLELPVAHNTRIRFPRLSNAQVAVATWQGSAEINRDQARQGLMDARASVAQIAHDNQNYWMKDWTSDVLAEFAGSVAPFPVNVFVKASVHVFLAKTLNRTQRQAVLAWHKAYDPAAAGDGYDALIKLASDFHSGGDYRTRAEKVLVSAFLADLDAEYRRLSSWMNRVASPLALLDNIHAHSVGIQFLRLVLASRFQSSDDPLVVVATGPESGLARMAVKNPGDDVMPPVPDSWLETHLRTIQLTRLGQGDVLSMLSGADKRRLEPDLAHLVHRLTGGLPLAVDAITRAIAFAAPADGPRDRAAVESVSIPELVVPAPDDHPKENAASYILNRLIPDERWRKRCVTLAAARDAEPEAQELVDRYLAAGEGGSTVDQAEEFLRANGWESGPRYFVADPLLRFLLFHQASQPESRPTSMEVHTALRGLYDPAGTGQLDEAERVLLYHRLALGDATDVVDRLHSSFTSSDAGSWLGALCDLVHSPHGGQPDERRAVALGEVDDDTRDDIYRSVNRLLHAAWFLTDPLVPPDDEVIEQLAGELNFLARRHPTGTRVLSTAGRTWPVWLRTWRQTWSPLTAGE